MSAFTPDQLKQLQTFIEVCRMQPAILHMNEFKFFKDYIESLGGKVPASSAGPKSFVPNPEPKGETPQPESKPKPAEESEEESDVEIDNEGVIEPDTVDDDPLPNPEKEVSEEDVEKSNESRSKAMEAFQTEDFETAIQLYTQSIALNPGSAVPYAKRGQTYLKLQKPNACIRDCTQAIKINPNSAIAFKFRGRAHRLLGHWEEAASDLWSAARIDFDEQVDEWLKEVTPNAKKLADHRRKQERRKADKEFRARQERVKQAREAQERARQQQEKQEQGGQDDEEGAMPGMGNFYKLFNDPETMNAFKDPEVAAAFLDISTNPANMLKYQGNPKIAAIISKLTSKYASAGGGGFPGMGGMGGFPGRGGSPPGAGGPGAGPGTGFDDAGLD